MTTLGLDHYNIRAPAELLEVVRDFYCELLGLVPGPRPPLPIPGHWLYAGEHPVVHLSATEAPPAETQAARATGWLGHVAFACSDPAAAREQMERMGVEYATAVIPSLRQLQYFLTDPAGIRVELNFRDQDPA